MQIALNGVEEVYFLRYNNKDAPQAKNYLRGVNNNNGMGQQTTKTTRATAVLRERERDRESMYTFNAGESLLGLLSVALADSLPFRII